MIPARTTLSIDASAATVYTTIVIDGGGSSIPSVLEPFLSQYRKQLSLLLLPPYSPQLAPIEHVWKLARRLATHNRYFATLTEVLDAVNACFDYWRQPNAVLR